jgi:SAM-dependent methyltransferase
VTRPSRRRLPRIWLRQGTRPQPRRPRTRSTPATTPAAAAEGNPVRGRFNSWFLDLLDGYVERRLGDVRREFLGGLDGELAEIGAGNGPTFRHLRPGTVVHAIEPNPYFHKRLAAEARRRGVDLVLHPVSAERIDLPDGSVDAVVSSLVLCTVEDPAAVLAEVRRILRPGGRFVFLEHVAARPGTAVRRVQRAVARPWRWLFEGCHTGRDTLQTIRAAGFTSVDVRDIRMATVFVPIRDQIAGTATR